MGKPETTKVVREGGGGGGGGEEEEEEEEKGKRRTRICGKANAPIVSGFSVSPTLLPPPSRELGMAEGVAARGLGLGTGLGVS